MSIRTVCQCRRWEKVRPLIEFAPDDARPLSDWKGGITLERAIEFIAPVLRKH